MEYTGERVVPKIMNPKNGMLIEHIERYIFAKDFCIVHHSLNSLCCAGFLWSKGSICSRHPG